MNRQHIIRSTALIGGLVVAALLLGAWKYRSLQATQEAAANQPEPVESIQTAMAREREHRPVTTSIGTVMALRSITLRNEIAGTVKKVSLTPGQVVEPGTVLVALDVSVEEAELQAQKAQADLAEQSLARTSRMTAQRAASEMELDAARAERDVALAQMARTRAVIARKTIRAPFRARVGISDVHPGQYLNEGTLLTTLQGVDDGAHVDFTVAQQVASGLKQGDRVDVFASDETSPIQARILAIDSRVDPTTRNATVRARIDGKDASNPDAPSPGASVRVRIPVATARMAVAVPTSALRKGPAGDHVFVIVADASGKTRAHQRPVQAGPAVGDDVIIHSGLEAGEEVAVSGSFKLREAVLVSIAGDSKVAKND
jgi:membrane fusion protein (multidrug efflux system)